MTSDHKVILVGRGALADQIFKKIRQFNTGIEVIGTYVTSQGLKSNASISPELDSLPNFDSCELDLPTDYRLVSAIGYSNLRRRLINLLDIPLKKFITVDLSQQSSIIAPLGCFIDRGTIIDPGVDLRSFCHIDISASIGEDTLIGEGCYIANNATICGSVKIGRCTMIGAGSLIYDGVSIGNNCMIGAGSIIQQDVPSNTTVFPQQKHRLLGH